MSELVAQALGTAPRQLSMGRVEVTSAAETHADAVLTLDEVAVMLKVGPDIVRSRAEDGDLPGRRFGDEWRFSKLAVLTWLADGDSPGHRRRR